jgi:Tol biopolymer transport system component
MVSLAFVTAACSDAMPGVGPISTPDPIPPPAPLDLAPIRVLFGTEEGLFISNGDGSDRRKLADGIFANIDVSPDGNRIAFVRGGALFVSDIGGTNAEVLADSVVGKPDWSADGRRIAYASTDGRLRVMSLDSLQSMAVTPRTQDGRDDSPAWSPGGSIVFIRYEQSDDDYFWLTTIAFDSTASVWRVLPSRGPYTPFARTPVWSGDGSSFAYIEDQRNQRSIRTLNAETGIPSGILTLPSDGVMALLDWSPDGKWIVFQGRDAGGQSAFFVTDMKGRTGQLNTTERWTAAAFLRNAQ